MESFYGAGVIWEAKCLDDLIKFRRQQLKSLQEVVGKTRLRGEETKMSYPFIGNLKLQPTELRILEFAAQHELSTEGGEEHTKLLVAFAKAAPSPTDSTVEISD